MPSLCHCEKEFIDVLATCADNGAEVNISMLCERLTFDVISKTAFGIDTGVQKNPDHQLFQTAITVLPNILEEFAYHTCQNLYSWPWLVRLLVKVLTKLLWDPVTEMRNKAKAVIEFRRQNPQELGTVEMIPIRYDTTRLALTYWFYLMGKHPSIQEKMRKEALDAYKLELPSLSPATFMLQTLEAIEAGIKNR
ncbi:hypothetical protein HPB48_008901 [Haemaphysalis longicornis]|uniref:Cytochrome P450 n=1 Tax=Haemaphysalis longicornis TaxID=44386 RepID=A0A9J6FT44_HAELO|nr:hypothetical protein HPB48_008901 [Haemaphysalis longicornis]